MTDSLGHDLQPATTPTVDKRLTNGEMESSFESCITECPQNIVRCGDIGTSLQMSKKSNNEWPSKMVQATLARIYGTHFVCCSEA